MNEPEPTLLPADGPDMAVRIALGEGGDPYAVAAAHPASSYAWSVLAEAKLRAEGSCGDVTRAAVEGYAFARVGYHRGLDALRRAGWRGTGPVPYGHEPNQGFLRSLLLLERAACLVGERDEADRCHTFVDQCDPRAREMFNIG